METVEVKEESASANYKDIIKSKYCNIVLIGIEDIKLLHKVIGVLYLRNRMYDDDQWFTTRPITGKQDMIFFHKIAPVHQFFWGDSSRSEDGIKFRIINSFITEHMYNSRSIKYLNMDDIHRNYQYENVRRYIRAMNIAPIGHHPAPTANTNTAANDEKQEYKEMDDVKDHDQTLRMQHFMAADGFMIVYDVRDQTELIKVRRYLDEIFELKGYNQFRKKLNENKLCFFPVTLIGINHEIVEDKSKMISRAQISEIVSEYNIWHQRKMSIHLKDGEYQRWYLGGGVKRNYEEDNKICAEWNAFSRMVLDYHYYQSLSDEQIRILSKPKSDCIIL